MRCQVKGKQPVQSIEDKAGKAYCRLFGDRITVHLCDIRRMELSGKGGFSCNDCPMAAQVIHEKAAAEDERQRECA